MSLTQSQDLVYEDLERRIGDYTRASKNLMQYVESTKKTQGELDDAQDSKYCFLQKNKTKAKQHIINISPTAIKELSNIDAIPDPAHKIAQMVYRCITADLLNGTLHNSEELKPLDSLTTSYEIPKFKKDSNGNILTRELSDEDDNVIRVGVLDGDLTETITVFNGKPEDIQNVFKQVLSSIKQSNSSKHSSFEDDFEDGRLTKEDVLEMISDLKTEIIPTLEQTVYSALQNPEVVKVINTQIATSFYTQMYNDYLDAFKAEHFDSLGSPKTQYGQSLLSNISYQKPNADGSLTLTTGRLIDALELYTNKELVDAFKDHNKQNSEVMFTNTLGQNKTLNRTFIDFIMNGMSIASNRLIGHNPSFPKEMFSVDQKPANPYAEIIQEPNLFQRIQEPGNLHNSIQGNGYNLFNNQQAQAPQYNPQQSYNNLQSPYNNPVLQAAPTDQAPVYQSQPNNQVDDARQAVNNLMPENQVALPAYTGPLKFN